MITVDSSEFVKKGKESVGVARQYCGTLGKVENCQSGVFAGYSSDKGYGIVADRLYMPERWFSEEYAERREKTMVPEDLEFRTKPEIAKELIREVAESGFFPAKWLGCDATFGSDTGFLKSVASTFNYFASVKSDTRVFVEWPKVGIPPYKGRGRKPGKLRVLPGEPKPLKVKELVGKMKFEPVVFSEGSKGPVTGKAAMTRVYRSVDGLPEDESLWLFARRDGSGKTRFALSNAPENISLEEMCEASIMRWPIEQCFREGKDQVGMGHYEHRSWPAWHRHMLFVSLALHFLLRLRIKYKKKPRA
jgi:SRSO17 transposase